MRLAIARPVVGPPEARALAAAVLRGEISRGPSIGRFERAFERMLGSGHAAALSTGTAAVEVLVRALGLSGEEIVTGAMSCQATANALLAAGCTIRFADHDPETFQPCASGLARAATKRTRALLAAHLYGDLADLDQLRRAVRSRRLLLLEDCAQCLGARWRGRAAGTLGDAAAFSFYANKLITTGEGGIVHFRSAAVVARARRIRDHGQDRPFHHIEYGLNWKMPSILAVLGLAQIRRARALATARRLRSRRLRARLASSGAVVLAARDPRCLPAPFSLPILRRRGSGSVLRARLDRAGIETRPLFPPQFDQPYWGRYAPVPARGRFPVARDLAHRGLYLSVSPHLSMREIDRIAEAVLAYA